MAWSSAGADSFANGSKWHTGNRSHPAIAARLLDPAGCQATGHGVDDTSVDSAATEAAQHYLVTPAFEHIAFPVALGFVAGFVDIFGFVALFGLLPAHVTGNLIFIAVDIARHQYNLIMKIAALPIFAASVAISAWLIGTLNARRRQTFLPVVLLQAAVLGLSLIVGLLMPAATSPDDATVALVGSTMLFAMGLVREPPQKLWQLGDIGCDPPPGRALVHCSFAHRSPSFPGLASQSPIMRAVVVFALLLWRGDGSGRCPAARIVPILHAFLEEASRASPCGRCWSAPNVQVDNGSVLAARSRVCSPSHPMTTAEVLLRADRPSAVDGGGRGFSAN